MALDKYNPNIELVPLQKIMLPYVEEIIYFWWIIFFLVLAYLIYKNIIKEIIIRRSNKHSHKNSSKK